MVRNVEHFKIYLLALFISSFENCLVTCSLVSWQSLFPLFFFKGAGVYVCLIFAYYIKNLWFFIYSRDESLV